MKTNVKQRFGENGIFVNLQFDNSGILLQNSFMKFSPKKQAKGLAPAVLKTGEVVGGMDWQCGD